MARKYKTLSGRGGPPNPIDIHVGQRISHQRRLLGMTQQQLAASIGLTFQQVQKYENGSNRIAASRIYDLSCVLGVEIGFFFADMPDEIRKKSPSQLAGIKARDGNEIKDSASSEYVIDPLEKTETLELVRNYYRITDNEMRQTVFNLCKQISKEIVGRKPLDKVDV